MVNAKTAHEAEVKAKMAEWKTKMDTMKTNVDQCFTKNSCTVPTFNSTKDATRASNNVSSEIKASLDKLKTCMKESAGLVETCVSSKSGVTFKFPEMKDDGAVDHNGFQGEHHFGGEHHQGDWNHHEGGDGKDFASKFCAGNTASANAVIECLKALKPTPTSTPASAAGAGKEHKQWHHGPHKNPICEVRDNCTKNLSADCQSQLTKIKDALCPCAQDEATKAKFLTCMNITEHHQQKRGADHQSKFQRGGNAGGDKKNFVQGFAMRNMGPEIFCHDPCDENQELSFKGFGHPDKASGAKRP
jgi:hypothetical protein